MPVHTDSAHSQAIPFHFTIPVIPYPSYTHMHTHKDTDWEKESLYIHLPLKTVPYTTSQEQIEQAGEGEMRVRWNADKNKMMP